MMKLEQKEKEVLDWIKEYLSVIIVVPAVLGGAWQLIELSIISTSFIRFFSVTQVVADGLLILFIFLMIMGSIKIIVHLNGNHFEFSKLKKLKDDTKNPVTRLLRPILYTIIIFIILYCVYLSYQTAVILKSLSFLVLLLAVNTIMLLIFIKLMFQLIVTILKFKKSKIIEDNIHVERIYSIIVALAFLFFIIVPMVRYFNDYKANLMFPPSLKNLEYIDCKLKNNYISEVNYHIRYQNDTYIFIEIIKESKKSEYIIIKFDEFLNSENCK